MWFWRRSRGGCSMCRSPGGSSCRALVAVIGGGGTFLRINVPERYAAALKAGAAIRLSNDAGDREGRLARIYPLIEAGRVVADVEVKDLPDGFVGNRLLVRLPVGQRAALLVPQTDIVTRSGLDFIGIDTAAGSSLRSVVPGRVHVIDGVAMVEVLSGLRARDVVIPATEVGNE